MMTEREKFLKGFELWGYNKEDIEVYEEEAFIQCLDGMNCYNLNLFPQIDKEALFNFKSLKLDKEKFFNLLSKLDEDILRAVECVTFINSEEELCDYMDEISYYQDAMDIEDELGKYLGTYRIVMVNMVAIKKFANENAIDCDDEKRLMNIGIWTSLLHELRHSIQEHPYFYHVNFDEDEEFDAEKYARKAFRDILENEDYYVVG